jgi:putative Mg2+ transporter-C (MgtC) family protein
MDFGGFIIHRSSFIIHRFRKAVTTMFWDELIAGLPDATELTRGLIRLGAAVLLGAIVGIERERTGKSAGARTHMLVSLGAALFVLGPLQYGMHEDALSRVIQGLTTGIGLIGGGTILKLSGEGEIKGLTTAAGIWMTAGIGVTAGLGRYGLAAIGAAVTWLILRVPFHPGPHGEAAEDS